MDVLLEDTLMENFMYKDYTALGCDIVWYSMYENMPTFWTNLLSPSSGYPYLTSQVVMTYIDVMHVSNYSIGDMMPVGNANLYVVLASTKIHTKRIGVL
jgi:hypothetical protein